jgi:hypothetical protein
MCALIASGLKDLLMQAATLQSKCFLVNGSSRNVSYDGWVDPVNQSIEAPPACATDEGTNLSGSLIVGGKYKVKFEYYNKNRSVPSAMSPVSAEITCQSNGGIKMDIPANAGVDSQVTHIRAYLTANGGSVYRLDDADGKAYTGSAITYDFTVAEASRKVAMGELASDGKSNLDIHGIFPTVKYILAFKDRLWGLGTETFSGGTAAVTNGSKTVTLSDDTLPTGIADGYTHFHIDGDSRKYLINTRTDDTNFELVDNYDGTTGTGKSYYIYGENSYLYYSYTTTGGIPYPESHPSDHYLPINKDDNDVCTGHGVTHNQIVCFKTRSMGIVSGTSQSNYQFTTITTETGCISGYTIDNNDKGDLLFLSEKGLCLTNGNEIVNLSESQIGNIFTGEGNPPWTVEKSLLGSACGAYDILTNRYRLFITEDGETQNIKRVVYDFNKVNGQAIGWYEEDGIVARCCGILEDSDGSPKVAFGCDGGSNADKAYVYYYDEDVTNDGAGTTSTKRGTATAADATSLTDSAATFTNDILGCNVSIISGTGADQAVRRIYTRDSATKFTIETAWDTTPDTTSVYCIGAINCKRVFKWMDFGFLKAKTLDMIKVIFKQASHSCYLKIYQDYSTTAKVDKTVDLDTEKGYRMKRLGQNRARLFQLECGLNDVDKPIVLKELQIDFRPQGGER